MAKTHPHIASPTREQLAALVADRPSGIAGTYLALHDLVLGAVPDACFSVDEKDASIGYGKHQFGYNGWGMAAVTPYSRWVSLTLLHGSQLEDPEGLLIGTTMMRHLKPTSPDEVERHREAIESLVREAARLHVG